MDEEQGLIIENNVVTGSRSLSLRVEIPAGVTGIAAGAFRYAGLTGLTIPAGLRDVGAEAFEGCHNLRQVEFPSGLETIGERAFADCLFLGKVVLPDTLREMAPDAFSGCLSLREVELSPGNRFWRQEGSLLWRRDGSALIWLEGSSDRTCQVPKGITRIPPQCFFGSLLEEITLPDSVEEIGDEALRACQRLAALRFPARLRSLGEDALTGCLALKEAVLPAGLRVLGRNALRDTPNLKRLVVLGELPEGWNTFSLSRLGIEVSESFDVQADRIPLEKVVRGSQDALLQNFARRWSAGEAIPEETRKNRLEFLRRRQKQYYGDPIFQNILLSEKLIGMKEIDGFLEEATRAGDTELVARLLEYQKKYIDLEEKARREEEKIRRDIRALTRPEPTLTELKRLWPGRVLEDGSWEIRGYGGATDALNAERELTVPAFLKKMPVTAVAPRAFCPHVRGRRLVVRRFLDSLKSVRLSDGIRSLGDHAFSDCWSLQHVRLPEGLEELPEYAFDGCQSLKRVEFPSTLKRIQARCFRFCVLLEELELTEGLEELGDEAFAGCWSLTQITLPPKLTELPASVFEDCDQLRSVRLPQGLRRVGSQAFVGCNSLAEIRLPDSVEEIREDAFGNLIGCIVASRGSYAYWWAMKNGVGVREP